MITGRNRARAGQSAATSDGGQPNANTAGAGMRSNPASGGPDHGQASANPEESKELLKEVRELIQLLKAEREAKKAPEKKGNIQ